MRDGPGRRAIKAVARAGFFLDVCLTRAWRRLRGERPYALGGACRRCAACCEAPALQAGVFVWHMPRLRRLFLWWQRRVNGFELTATDDRAHVFVFRCTHFDWATRSCDSYASRPGVCRDYPRALLRQPDPTLLPGCGYRPVAPNAARLRRALADQPLTPEQRERLERDLYLRN